jgi:hypothetical protein
MIDPHSIVYIVWKGQTYRLRLDLYDKIVDDAPPELKARWGNDRDALLLKSDVYKLYVPKA